MTSVKLARTTIRIPENLFFEIKKEAIMEKKTLTDLISEGLSLYIRFRPELKKFEKGKVTNLFGAWGKGMSGSSTIKKLRTGNKEKERDKFLTGLWSKSY